MRLVNSSPRNSASATGRVLITAPASWTQWGLPEAPEGLLRLATFHFPSTIGLNAEGMIATPVAGHAIRLSRPCWALMRHADHDVPICDSCS